MRAANPPVGQKPGCSWGRRIRRGFWGPLSLPAVETRGGSPPKSPLTSHRRLIARHPVANKRKTGYSFVEEERLVGARYFVDEKTCEETERAGQSAPAACPVSVTARHSRSSIGTAGWPGPRSKNIDEADREARTHGVLLAARVTRAFARFSRHPAPPPAGQFSPGGQRAKCSVSIRSAAFRRPTESRRLSPLAVSSRTSVRHRLFLLQLLFSCLLFFFFAHILIVPQRPAHPVLGTIARRGRKSLHEQRCASQLRRL